MKYSDIKKDTREKIELFFLICLCFAGLALLIFTIQAGSEKSRKEYEKNVLEFDELQKKIVEERHDSQIKWLKSLSPCELMREQSIVKYGKEAPDGKCYVRSENGQWREPTDVEKSLLNPIE